MDGFFEIIPRELFEVIVIALFSLIIGLSQKAIHVEHADRNESSFGTDRTFTFIGVLGYIFWISDSSLILYFIGLAIIAVFLAVNYFNKISLYQDFGLTTVVVALITYSLAALIRTQPIWLFLLVYVIVLVLTELKQTLNAFSQKVNKEEFLTLGKFLAIAGIILPIVPDKPIVSFLELTPYRIWLAVVVISSISYLSYLLRKFVFRDSGIIVAGILGGLYSSTATTIVLAKQSRDQIYGQRHFAAGILLATAMMYLRIAILMAIFSNKIFLLLLPWFLLMMAVSVGAALVVLFIRSDTQSVKPPVAGDSVNPLEFRVAIIFTLLFVAMSFITYFTVKRFGSNGLQALAYIVGVTDIDPFLINLFQGKFGVSAGITAIATMQAIFSNNLLKLVYGMILSGKKVKPVLLAGYSVILLASLLIIILL
jgi:uncharacterized membrane protein (DUF4010 family)